jgi:ATP-dependent DNA helicase PIF1
MLLKNYDEYNLYNGSIGYVMNFDKKTGYPIVKFENEILCISTDEWEIKELIIYEDNDNNLCKEYITLAKRIQIPLSLAWAITIHKSQGLTFKYLEVILTNTFTEGQMYVALSRAISIENLIISGFKKSHLKVNNNVIKFYDEEILEKYIINEISNIKIKD